MDERERETRAASFDGVAEAYERARPGYPAEAVRWLAGEDPRDVVDLGAGTGKLTRSLAAAGHRVTAVEPLPAMRAQLERAVPGVTALDGTAERIPLADGAADVVAVAQAFHWFDHPAALVEIARVLRPGGRLALVWNTRDDDHPWVARLSVVMGSETLESRAVEEPLAASGLFAPPERATFRQMQRLGRDALRDLVLSRSHCAVRPPEERAEILAEVDALVAAEAVDGVLELPYRVECFRAARAG